MYVMSAFNHHTFYVIRAYYLLKNEFPVWLLTGLSNHLDDGNSIVLMLLLSEEVGILLGSSG